MQGAVSELPRATGRRTQAHARFGLIDRGRLAALEFHTPSTACPLHRGRRRPSLSIKRSRTQLQLARPAPKGACRRPLITTAWRRRALSEFCGDASSGVLFVDRSSTRQGRPPLTTQTTHCRAPYSIHRVIKSPSIYFVSDRHAHAHTHRGAEARLTPRAAAPASRRVHRPRRPTEPQPSPVSGRQQAGVSIKRFGPHAEDTFGYVCM